MNNRERGETAGVFQPFDKRIGERVLKYQIYFHENYTDFGLIYVVGSDIFINGVKKTIEPDSEIFVLYIGYLRVENVA